MKRQIIYQGLKVGLLMIAGLLSSLSHTEAYGQSKDQDANLFILGPGDVLEITATPLKAPSERITRSVRIRPDGRISFDYVGDLQVEGLTPEEVDRLLTNQLERYIKGVDVTVVVTEFNAKTIYVFGEVNRPGKFPLDTRLTVLDAIALAGSFTPRAALSRVKLVRGDPDRPQVYKIDLRKVLDKGQLRHNRVLQGGDIIIVPADNWSRVGRFVSRLILPFRDVFTTLAAAIIVYSVFQE